MAGNLRDTNIIVPLDKKSLYSSVKLRLLEKCWKLSPASLTGLRRLIVMCQELAKTLVETSMYLITNMPEGLSPLLHIITASHHCFRDSRATIEE